MISNNSVDKSGPNDFELRLKSVDYLGVVSFDGEANY